VSAKKALLAKIEAGNNKEALLNLPTWKQSNFEELENYVLNTVIK
jgi:hypothetical protein